MRKPGLELVVVLAIATPLQVAEAEPSSAPPCTLEPGPTRAVAAVIDGETVRLDDGVEVRLIGSLAPSAFDAGIDGATASWPPAVEAKAALAALAEGKSVSLGFSGLRADRHGRVLAQLVLKDAAGDVWVQGRMVAQGHARAYALPESDGCATALADRERAARASGLGLWSNAAYQVRPADRPSELARYRHTFQLVRGHVEKARNTRSLTILELASNERPPATEDVSQKGAFHVVWPHRMAVTAGLARPADWQGKNVLVRGWIEITGGPEIEISGKGQIEIED
ncbi:MAG: thermonuclease family protein [Proteobacteria bacterium]|nr:thermonuclease family protein [Pseudomonadota bacterium]